LNESRKIVDLTESENNLFPTPTRWHFTRNERILIWASILNWAVLPTTFSWEFLSHGRLALGAVIIGAALMLFYKYIYWWLFGMILIFWVKKKSVSYLIASLAVASYIIYFIWGYPKIASIYSSLYWI
jgi:hypothetical protein